MATGTNPREGTEHMARGEGPGLAVTTIGVASKVAGTQGATDLLQLTERVVRDDGAGRDYGCGQSSIGESALWGSPPWSTSPFKNVGSALLRCEAARVTGQHTEWSRDHVMHGNLREQ